MKKKYGKTGMILILFLLIMFTAAGCDNNNGEEVTPVEEDEDVSQASIMQEDLIFENSFMSGIDMEVFWEFDEDQENLNMRLESPSAGWVAVGFEPSQRMADAQIIIGGFNDEELTVEEHYGTGSTSHEQIDEVYIDEYAGERQDEYTIIEFIIPLGEDSCYDLAAGEKYEVILAYHNESDNFLQRHSQRTSAEIEF